MERLINVDIDFCVLNDKKFLKRNKIFNILENCKNSNEILDSLIKRKF